MLVITRGYHGLCSPVTLTIRTHTSFTVTTSTTTTTSFQTVMVTPRSRQKWMGTKVVAMEKRWGRGGFDREKLGKFGFNMFGKLLQVPIVWNSRRGYTFYQQNSRFQGDIIGKNWGYTIKIGDLPRVSLTLEIGKLVGHTRFFSTIVWTGTCDLPI